MTDVPLGQSLLWTRPVVDANGNPSTSGVAQTYNVTGPTGTVVAAAQAVAHWGGGNWGFLIAPSALTVVGTYTVIPATYTSGPTDLQYRQYTFTVGLTETGVRTLRDILIDLGYALGDSVEGVTTALGTTATLIDARWKQGVDNELAGSQVLFLDRTSPLNVDPNPVTVTASAVASGTLTFVPLQTAAIPSGTPYTIGAGRYPHATRLSALRQVLEDLGPLSATGDRYTLTSVLNQYEYDVPQEFLDLSAVYFQPTTTTIPTVWRKLAKGIFWQYRRDRRKLEFTTAAPISLTRYRLEGTIEARLPEKLTDYVPVRAATVVRLAEVYLRSRDGASTERQEAAFLYQDLLRRGKVRARAGVVG